MAVSAGLLWHCQLIACLADISPCMVRVCTDSTTALIQTQQLVAFASRHKHRHNHMHLTIYSLHLSIHRYQTATRGAPSSVAPISMNPSVYSHAGLYCAISSSKGPSRAQHNLAINLPSSKPFVSRLVCYPTNPPPSDKWPFRIRRQTTASPLICPPVSQA
jgi:hypothetical protein